MHTASMVLHHLLPSERKRAIVAALLSTMLMVAIGQQSAKAQSGRQETSIPILSLIDVNATTVTNEGNNQFFIHFAFVSNPNYSLICKSSGVSDPPTGFDGVYGRLDESGNIVSVSTNGDCNLKSTITTVNGVNNVLLGYEVKFQLNGVPSEQPFNPRGAAMSTNIPVGQTVSLASVLM